MDYNFNAYEILGLPTSASRDDVDARYNELRAKYQRDRFLPGEEGEEAAEKMQQLEVAYRDILSNFDEYAEKSDFYGQEDDYHEIQDLITANKLDEAQSRLDARSSRNAEWHYVQSILFYKRSWYLESKKQLELACQMEPDNERYKQSLEKLTKILASNTISPDQMRTTSRPVDEGPRIGAGNGTCTGSSCGDCLLCNACCNCAQCMGGGC
ncbi:MAG: hypothetical protein NC132_05160 [Corallococcus sp.]|nr:hypothetical protein [Corallococcus sp.]MCM1359926.1 hypothetical protein [Corallococcus sp.]MCM1395482.1 hypothetical protein [Corallococcus sp.]